MNEQKNKQPQQGDEKDQNKSSQQRGGQTQGGQMGDGQQRTSQSQGSQMQGSQDSQIQGSHSQGSQMQGNQAQGGSQQPGNQQIPSKGNMADTKREQPMGSEIENPDRENDPEKKINIDDDPGQTKKKVPNMGK